MDRYTKGFVVASLIYFGIAAGMGIAMGAGVEREWLHFAHVHLNLLGFMAMMVYGVGYFILPRFNGKTLRFPSLLPVHFYLSNAGLLGMVITAESRPSSLFTLSAVTEGISIAIFVVNLIATLLSAEEQESPGKAAEKEKTPRPILPGMRVGEILERFPGIHEVFVKHGFQSLASETHREQVKGLPITVAMACSKHGVNVGALVKDLNEFIGVKVRLKSEGGADSNPGGGIQRGDRVESHHVLGDILKAYPETEEVFRKYYGEGCFSCPGQATESVKMSALMHNVSEEEILQELNSVIRREAS